MDAITFRLAELIDFDEIVELSEGIYGGHDYLPLKFHKWLQKDNMAVIVAHSSDNKLIGLLAYFIVDDHRTYVRRGERIHPELRGQGIVRKLREYARNHAKQRFPNLKRVRFTTTNENVNLQYHRKLQEWNYVEYEVEMKHGRQALTSVKESVEIKSCSREYFSDIILSSTGRAKLFPRGAMIVNWCPFEPLRSNIDHVLEDRNELFAEVCTDDSIPRSFSFGTYLPTMKFLDWQAVIYADDPGFYKAHLLYQFKRACKFINSDFVFVSFHDESWAELTKNVMEEQLQLKVHDVKRTYLYEKDFSS